jgi:phage/plasmid-like protein (TIGR03299 family)
MAHNINQNRMFCVGKAWHEIGVRVDKEQIASEAIKLANLDYKVEQRPLFIPANGDNLKVNDFVAICRQDDNSVLGITSPKYEIVQNVEAFGFFDTVVGEGQAVYHSAGALGQGERIWILAKLPNDIIINADDKVEKYLCLTNSHDGKSSLRMYFTPVRVVCQNTLNQSMGDAKHGIAIKHSGQIKNKIEEARKVLGISINYYQQFEKMVKQFEEKPLTYNEVNKYFDNVLAIKEDSETSTRKNNIKDELLSLFENGKGQKLGNRNSLWKGYNAVTEYVDYFRTVKNIEKDNSNKLASIWFGSGAKLKEKAYDEAVALIGA